MRSLASAGMLALLGGVCLRADFSYQETSKITGGMMAGVMRAAGVFSKQAREPIQNTVLIKGDRMATLSGTSGHIVDLQNETMTEIDFQKRTYSVVTFAQMAQAMKEMESRMAGEGGEQADISVKASVQETGQRKAIAGLEARQVVITLEMEGTDRKSGQRGVFMVLTSDMWLADVPGYEEVRSFHERLARKMTWMPGAGMAAAQRPDVSKGMAELSREAAKLEGVPVYQVIKVGFKGEAGGEVPPAEPKPRADQPEERPSVGGALGRLGGLGRLGRRREPAEQPRAAESAPPRPAEAGGVLMEVVSESSGFSRAPVDPARLAVPAGFKQVESPLLGGPRR